jgi:hypothetical protein
MAGPPPRRSNTTAYLLIGVALLCVVALVVVGVVWWRLSQADDPDLVDGQLAASYPVAPGAEWSITAASMGGQKFNSVIPSEGRYGTVGAIADGETLVTIVGDPYTSVGGSHWAVGVNARTGERWRFGEPVSTCADTIVDDSLVCRDADTLHFIDVRSGAALATVPAPPNTGGVAYNGDAAFVVEYVPATDSVVFHKITRDGPLWSRPVDNLPTAAPGSGDASAFTATDTTVVTSGLRVVGVSADDGADLRPRRPSGDPDLDHHHRVRPDGSAGDRAGHHPGGQQRIRRRGNAVRDTVRFAARVHTPVVPHRCRWPRRHDEGHREVPRRGRPVRSADPYHHLRRRWSRRLGQLRLPTIPARRPGTRRRSGPQPGTDLPAG